MPDDRSVPRERALFVGLSTKNFNALVREHSEFFFDIVDSVPPTAVPLLRGPGVIPHDVVIVAFSLEDSNDLPIQTVIDGVVTAFPESQYYFIFPDDQPEDPSKPFIDDPSEPFTDDTYEQFIDKVLAGRAPGRAVVSLRNFFSALEAREEDAESGPSPEAFGALDVLNDEIAITFDASLSAEQVKATLTALANYYRACGGVGLSVEFENQEAVTEEVHA